ncbi:PLP-dependent transferase [Neocallimastix californiae]|uniref:PLP-dependent transferase n=1 Tax=Neocallimastix californiae TaxID=1754190 RepID=A0A1Y2AJY7_9FUNG|nr:PLP-dependent transferase [Neocallimastix californiae]|eukprot:ORY22792.1 PLP-dependent transferase [Neocallimastix californiae]
MPIATALEPVSVISNKRNLKYNNFEKVPYNNENFKVTTIKNNSKKGKYFTPLNGPKLSKRALEIQNEEFLLSKGIIIVRNNKYHPESNPNGIINLGTAENKLNNVEMLSKINDPKISTVTAEQLLYGPNPGSDRLREEIAKLLNRHFNPKVLLNKENICVGNGCGPLLNLYGEVLFDAGDAFLVPGPFYGGFEADIKYGARVYPIPVQHEEDDCLKVSEESLEKALRNANRPVKGIIIANPNNPFGRCYSAEQLLLFCNFAKSHGLFVICDEIYGLSTWKDIVSENIEEESNKFTSIFSLDLPDPENTHGLWGFSKDFCLNGLRIGVTISYSKTVMAAIQKICFLTCIPTNIDNILVNILSDEEWTDNFIINNNRKLYKSYSHLTNSLNAHGIPYVKGDSGFFIYIDLHQAKIDEYDLWMKLLEGGIYISPSQAFFSKDSYSERNWFRICFAVEQKELDLSLERLYKVLETIKYNQQNK